MPLWPLKDASPDDGAFDRLRASIDPDWIDEALELTGTVTLRRRRLPAEQVIWLVLGRALYRDRPIAELVDKLDLALPDGRDLTVARSAVAQARARLGAEPMRWLFERCSRKWAHEAAGEDRWRGLALYGVDGTTTRTPDSPENRAPLRRPGVGARRERLPAGTLRHADGPAQSPARGGTFRALRERRADAGA